MAAKTFNENPVSKCSPILLRLETMVRAHAGCKRATALRGGPSVKLPIERVDLRQFSD